MATFEKRIGTSGKTTWRVRMCRQNGRWLTKSFAKKVDGEQWARTIEHKLDTGEHVPAANVHVGTVIGSDLQKAGQDLARPVLKELQRIQSNRSKPSLGR